MDNYLAEYSIKVSVFPSKKYEGVSEQELRHFYEFQAESPEKAYEHANSQEAIKKAEKNYIGSVNNNLLIDSEEIIGLSKPIKLERLLEIKNVFSEEKKDKLTREEHKQLSSMRDELGQLYRPSIGMSVDKSHADNPNPQTHLAPTPYYPSEKD